MINFFLFEGNISASTRRYLPIKEDEKLWKIDSSWTKISIIQEYPFMLCSMVTMALYENLSYILLGCKDFYSIAKFTITTLHCFKPDSIDFFPFKRMVYHIKENFQSKSIHEVNHSIWAHHTIRMYICSSNIHVWQSVYPTCWRRWDIKVEFLFYSPMLMKICCLYLIVGHVITE